MPDNVPTNEQTSPGARSADDFFSSFCSPDEFSALYSGKSISVESFSALCRQLEGAKDLPPLSDRQRFLEVCLDGAVSSLSLSMLSDEEVQVLEGLKRTLGVAEEN